MNLDVLHDENLVELESMNIKYVVLFSFSRLSGVRMKAPSMKDILDLDQANVSEPELLRITAPPLPKPPRSVPLKTSSFVVLLPF